LGGKNGKIKNKKIREGRHSQAWEIQEGANRIDEGF
jgi:hypothetical protein